jgi:hypothetical protein
MRRVPIYLFGSGSAGLGSFRTTPAAFMKGATGTSSLTIMFRRVGMACHPSGTQPELVAHHYTEANCPAQAIAYWLRAGAAAASRSANLEAIDQFHRGLELVGADALLTIDA